MFLDIVGKREVLSIYIPSDSVCVQVDCTKIALLANLRHNIYLKLPYLDISYTICQPFLSKIKAYFLIISIIVIGM